MSLPSTHVNTNPLAFEELATALASLSAFNSGSNMSDPIEEYQHLYTKAMKQPLGYREITELTGNGLDAGDRRAGRAAWLLLNIESLKVVSVHSVLWHKVKGKFSAPLLGQLSRALNMPSHLSSERLQKMGNEPLLVDVAGVKDGAIWLVQTVWAKDLVDSVVKRSVLGKMALFKSRVFNDPIMEGNSIRGLYMAYDLVRKAFPDVPVYALGLAMHLDGPDFELYQIDISPDRPARVVLREDRVRRNAIDFTDRLNDDNESLLMLPQRVDDDSFRCVPPCRGGRTLAVLAATTKRQLNSEKLLLFKEQEFRKFLQDDYDYEVTRDKIRHDLVDRLVGQGFMRKWGSHYFLTVKGMARYQYCLAKYTTLGDSDSMQVLGRCTEQRDRIVTQFGCLI